MSFFSSIAIRNDAFLIIAPRVQQESEQCEKICSIARNEKELKFNGNVFVCIGDGRDIGDALCGKESTLAFNDHEMIISTDEKLNLLAVT